MILLGIRLIGIKVNYKFIIRERRFSEKWCYKITILWNWFY